MKRATLTGQARLRALPWGADRLCSLGLGAALWLAWGLTGHGAGALRVERLRCEYRENPLGIDVARPRLSWVLASKERDQRQTAWHILVASTEGLLRSGRGDIWDSGLVPSAQSTQVEYAGPPLRSRQRCWWKVRVADRQGRLSDWSAPAYWEMGLLQPSDWQARWIGLEQTWPGQASWAQARWIWYPEGDPTQAAPTGEVVTFRRDLVLTNTAGIDRAHIRLTADDYFELYVNGQFVGRNAGKPYSCKILQEYDLRPFLVPGTNWLAVLATNREGPAGLLGQLTVTFQQPPPVVIQTDQTWWVAQGAQTNWAQPAAPTAAWRPARELVRPGQPPWPDADYPPMLPAPFFRKEVFFPKPIQQARLYATALGVYEWHINGQRVGVDVFNPGWTDYAKRVQYHTYDVTRLLRRGTNALGIILGDGWYAGFVGLGGRCRYGRLPLALAQLEVWLADGSRQVIVTDGTWKATTGPILQSDMLMGEIYDARREMPGWARPGFDDRAWQPVTVKPVSVPLVAACDEPVRPTQELKPMALTQPRPGVFVFDLGQNMVGWARLKARGPAGQTVTLRFAEMTNADGTIYTDNLREARCTDQYVLRGTGQVEVFEPRFTFHGFRYVELTGLPGPPDWETITGVVVHSDTPRAGTFACSDPRINRLMANIDWSQRGNFLSVPTDCPQRDERLGWTGDAQVFLRTATYNRHVAAFFTKWCQDLQDAQQPDGAFPDVAPYVAASTGTAAWGDAGVICPWTIYQVYGDRRILERHYEAGARWIEYLHRHSTNGLRPPTRYGDWLAVGADTPLDVLATAYFAYSTRLMAQIAAVLGNTNDAARYEALFQGIKSAFNWYYVTGDGRIKGNTQTCYLMALAFDLLPPEKRPQAIRHLTLDIADRGDHLSTGFVGAGLLLPVLTEAGRLDLAYRLLLQDTFPSWLFSVRHGATTIWERWDGWTPDKGFQTPWMNSFNHYALGSVGAWLYETVAGLGLDPAQPGFKHILIRPRPGGGLSWARAEFESLYGRIVSAWHLAGVEFRLQLVIPPNTTATVWLPIASPRDIREGRMAAVSAEGVRFLRTEGACTVLQVGSGSYEFAGPMAWP